MSATQLVVVCFPVNSLQDLVSGIGTGDYGGNTTAQALPTINSQFFIGNGVNGPVLCTVKTTDAVLSGTFIDNSGTYSVDAVIAPPTVVYDLVGGRPDDRR